MMLHKMEEHFLQFTTFLSVRNQMYFCTINKKEVEKLVRVVVSQVHDKVPFMFRKQGV